MSFDVVQSVHRRWRVALKNENVSTLFT